MDAALIRPHWRRRCLASIFSCLMSFSNCGTNVLTDRRCICLIVQSQHNPLNLDLEIICLLLLFRLRVSLRPCLARSRRIDRSARSGPNQFFAPGKDVWLIIDTPVTTRLEHATTTTSRAFFIILCFVSCCAMCFNRSTSSALLLNSFLRVSFENDMCSCFRNMECCASVSEKHLSLPRSIA